MEFAELILVPKLDNVVLKGPHHGDVDGTLCITGHHIILSSRKEGVQELWLLHRNIDLIEKKENKPGPNAGTSGGGGVVTIKCKDLRILQLDIGTTSDLNKVHQSLENLAAIADMRLFYPFFYKPINSMLEDGYNLFRTESEYSKALASDEWRLSYVNRDYTVCSTYPQCVVAPKNVDDETLAASAAFRKGGRFPVLSYRHENGAVLMRCSQPMIGPQNKRCKADEKLLNSVLGPSKKGFIVDLRSPALITVQKGKGGGTESSNYPRWHKSTKPMDKVCNVQLLESFTRLMEVCNDKDISCDKWLSKLDSCGWLGHILNTLTISCTIAQCIAPEGSPVLVHGTRGTDSTLVVCSLVQVILNPDCRTVRGFQALIDREWIQAGHPFSDRHDHSCYYAVPPSNSLRKASFSSSGNQMPPGCSPTFLLFLDCVHQLLEQFPCSFEFKQDLLVLLFEHSYFSQYGSFLGNCEFDRHQIDLFKETTSLWSQLNTPDIVQTIISPLYEPNQGIIWPSVAPMSLVLWEELYLRWVIDFSEQRSVLDRISKIRQKDKELRVKALRLRKQLRDLVNEIKELDGADTGQNPMAVMNSPPPQDIQNIVDSVNSISDEKE